MASFRGSRQAEDATTADIRTSRATGGRFADRRLYAALPRGVPRGGVRAAPRFRVCFLAALPLVVLLGGGCGRDDGHGRDGPAEEPPEWAGFPAPPTRPYEVADVMSGGSITGEVVLRRARPEGARVRVTIDPAVCGSDYTERTVLETGGRIANVVVWLHDVRLGRRLPIERLFSITNRGCQVTPRTQAMFTGGTVNVRSVDPVAHRLRFTRLHDGELLSVVRHNDAGQVVPVQDLLARPGLIGTQCEIHPWMRGWIAVFDHPYVAVTAFDGRFAIDAVPPGTYRLVAWHEALGRVEREVVVGVGEQSRVQVEY